MDHVEIKMPKISIQESVEAVENVPFDRMQDFLKCPGVCRDSHEIVVQESRVRRDLRCPRKVSRQSK